MTTIQPHATQRVARLVAHQAMILLDADPCSAVAIDALDSFTGLRATRAKPLGISDYLRARFDARPGLTPDPGMSGRGVTNPITMTRPESIDRARRLAEDLPGLCTDVPATIDSDFGSVRTVDQLRATLIELMVAAHDTDAPTAEGADAECVRTLAEVLRSRFAGQSIEIRVPPFAAVQVGAFGEGPTHTRGTPPNVIEIDPQLFFELAVGLATWDAANPRVAASGAHVDQVARMLPVIRLRA